MSALTLAAPQLAGVVRGSAERLLYQEMTDVARFLVNAKQDQNDDVLKATLREVERLLTTGSVRVRELLIVGLLEDVQNFSMRADIPLGSWERFLGAESTEGWTAIERMWSGALKAEDFQLFVTGKEM